MREIRFLSPIEGDLLITGIDGTIKDGLLQAPIRVAASEAPLINGQTAHGDGTDYVAVVPMQAGENLVKASLPDGSEATIRLWWLKSAERTYRFTVDDCIRCFEDITRHQDEYASIFDQPFLAIFHQAHERYGSRVHINAFYESVDKAFNLSMMTDKFRDEFRANADWLTLSFHSYAEFPDAPYQNASYEQVKADCALCVREIERFAGREALSDTTTLHWGAANAEGVRALRDAGYQALCGYLCLNDKGRAMVSYHLTKEQVAHAQKREGWVDFEQGMLFAKLDFVLNDGQIPATRVASLLDELCQRPHEGQLIQMVIHEQYFYADYHHYEMDYSERILNMAKWMHEHNYRSVSLSELMRGE